MDRFQKQEYYEYLKDQSFKRGSSDTTLKKGRKEYSNKEIRRHIEDNKGVELTSGDITEVITMFHFRTTVDVQDQSSLYKLYNQENTFYYQSYCGKFNQLTNLKTFRTVKDVAKSVLKIDIQNHEDLSSDRVETNIRLKTRSAEFRYEPYNLKKSYLNKNEDDILNMFVPPVHSFYQENPEKPPQTIMEFLVHLFDGRSDEIEYCLDWLSTMLKKKNNCYLTLVGDQGVGKNTLTEIIAAGLVGDDNFGLVSNSRLKKEFTNFLIGNQLIHFSETNLDDNDVLNKLKLFQDAIVEIERKSKDTYKTDNFMNGIITSNDNHKIRIQPGERRYSFLKLTGVNFVDSPLFKKFDTYESFKQKIISEIPTFYWWLRQRQVDRLMSKPYINQEHFDDIFTSSMSRQENDIMTWVIEHCTDGQTHTVGEIEVALQNDYGKMTLKPTNIYKFLGKIQQVQLKRKTKPITDTPFTVDSTVEAISELKKWESKTFSNEGNPDKFNNAMSKIKELQGE